MAHVLLSPMVADSKGPCAALVDLLTQDGHAVTGLGCAEDVVQAVSLPPTDLHLLDLSLPVQDGRSLTRRLRSAQPEDRLGHAELRDRMAGHASGADICLNRPFYPEELVSIVR